MVTEGAYPFVHGGVTTWCDQLIRGLPELDFAVAAVCGSGRERAVVELPDNVRGLHPVAVWAPVDPPTRAPRRVRHRVAQLHETLLRAMYAPDPADGVGDFVAALAELHRLGRFADIGALLRTDDAVHRVHDVLRDERKAPRRTGFARVHPLADALQAADLLDHFLRALWAPPVRAEVTHCVCVGLPVLQALAAKWAHGTPFILSEHGVYLRERYLADDGGAYAFPVRDFVLRFMRLLVLTGYREAHLITPVCAFNQRWQERLGADPDTIRPVYNGIDPDRFPPAEDEPDVPTLTWVGRIDPLKDVETLIRAFARVRAAIPDARLRMFGPTPPGNEAYDARCRALVHELGLDDCAVFEGRESNVARAYRAGHVVVLSSLSEAFPYTVIEGMASGRASVATDVGGVSEAIGDAGRIVPPRDPEAMAAACCELLLDDDLRHTMADRARTRALAEFTLDGFLGIYREIYGRYVGARSAVRSAAVGEPVMV